MHTKRASVRRGLVVPALTLAMVVAALGAVAPAQADPGTARVPSPVRVANTSPSDSSTVKTVTVSCPRNAPRVYGTGATVTNGGDAVILAAITPNLLLTDVTARAVESVPYAGAWSVTVYAVCGPDTRNLQRIHFTSDASSANKTVRVTCPAGLRLYGTGAELDNGLGRVFFSGIVPNSGLTEVIVTAVENGFVPWNWSVTGYAICGNPAARMTRVAASSAINSLSDKSVITPFCPGGTHVHGVGAQTDFGFGFVFINDMQPNLFLFRATAGASERGNFLGLWRVTSYAICSS